MDVATVACDVCGRSKGETNHWLQCITQPAKGDLPEIQGIGFGPIDAPISDADIKVEHICGHACAVKRFSQWLETLNANSTPSNENEAQ
jgi:hypothetical protein